MCYLTYRLCKQMCMLRPQRKVKARHPKRIASNRVVTALTAQEFGSYSEAYRAVAEFTEFYNKRRLHSSIHYMAPEEFHEAHERNLVKVTPIRV